MKKYVSLFLCILLIASLAACGTKPAVQDPAPQPQTQPQAQPSDPVQSGTQTNAPAAVQTPEPQQDPVPSDGRPYTEHLSLYKYTDGDYDYGQEGDTWVTYATCEYEGLSLTDEHREKYPEMAQTLDDLNAELADEALNSMEQYAQSAREYFAEYTDMTYYTPNFYENHLFVTRADNNLLSFVNVTGSYMGGIHPDTWYGGYNFDPETGKEIAFTELVNDEEAFKDIVIEKLLEKYPVTFSEYDQSSMHSVLENEFMVVELTDMDGKKTGEVYTPAWTAGNQGVTVYFSPYEIASYADGLLTVTVLYSEAPELFDMDRAEPAPDYVTAIIPSWDFDYDLGNDGVMDNITVISAAEYDPDLDESFISSVTYGVNGNTEELYDLYATDAESYLVHVSDGTDMIFTQVSSLWDGEIDIYDITGGAPAYAGTVEGWFDNGILTGLENISVGHLSQIAGTFYATRNYYIGDYGTFGSDYEQYSIFTENSMMTIADMSLPVVEGGIADENDLCLIPSGSEVVPVATDSATYLDLWVYGADTIVRLYVTFGEYESDQYLEDGRSLYDVFEMVYWGN